MGWIKKIHKALGRADKAGETVDAAGDAARVVHGADRVAEAAVDAARVAETAKITKAVRIARANEAAREAAHRALHQCAKNLNAFKKSGGSRVLLHANNQKIIKEAREMAEGTARLRGASPDEIAELGKVAEDAARESVRRASNAGLGHLNSPRREVRNLLPGEVALARQQSIVDEATKGAVSNVEKKIVKEEAAAVMSAGAIGASMAPERRDPSQLPPHPMNEKLKSVGTGLLDAAEFVEEGIIWLGDKASEKLTGERYSKAGTHWDAIQSLPIDAGIKAGTVGGEKLGEAIKQIEGKMEDPMTKGWNQAENFVKNGGSGLGVSW
jgi:hypothetical protein